MLSSVGPNIGCPFGQVNDGERSFLVPLTAGVWLTDPQPGSSLSRSAWLSLGP